MFLLLTQDRERCHGLEAPHGSRETGEHSGAGMLNGKVGIPGGTVICRLRGRLSFLDHIENLQRGWYRGFIVFDFPVPERAAGLFLGLFL